MIKNTALVCAIGIISLSGCRTDDNAEDIFNPLSSGGSCVDGFKHSSKIQTLEVKNETMKLLKLIEIISTVEGKPQFDPKDTRSISIAPTQSHKISFVVDSFKNGGSMIYQANDSGEKLISYDPICAESSQEPLFLIHSEGINAWLGVKLDGSTGINLNIGISDDWADNSADSRPHLILVNEESFKVEKDPEVIEPAMTIKPE